MTKTIKLSKILGRLWIEYDRQSPDEGGEYLVTDGQRVDIGWFGKDGRFHGRLVGNPIKPSHWMPMPKLPGM
ncbi:MAG: DUF551 domain-containing protein [Magnetococcus sp. DMHC-6]